MSLDQMLYRKSPDLGQPFSYKGRMYRHDADGTLWVQHFTGGSWVRAKANIPFFRTPENFLQTLTHGERMEGELDNLLTAEIREAQRLQRDFNDNMKKLADLHLVCIRLMADVDVAWSSVERLATLQGYVFEESDDEETT